MRTIHDNIEEILNEPPKQFTKEEARAVLANLGVVDENGEVVEDFKDIFVKKSTL